MPRKLLVVNREHEKTSLRYKIALIIQLSFIFLLLALYLVITPTSVTAGNFAGFEVGDFQSQFSEVDIGKDLPPENGAYGYHSLSTTASTSSPFTVIALPDTQHYTDSPGREVIFNSQTTWAVNSQSVRNIVFLSHLGDLTENGGEDFDDNEWIIADTAMSILERTADPSDDLPFGVTPGNHDTMGGTTKFEEWFGVARFSGRSYYGGHYGSDNLNSYGLFSASGLDFILIHIDSSDSTPSAGVLEWADGLLKADINRRGIVVTHRPLGSTGNPASFSAAGQAIYDALKDNPNFFLMLGGHLNGEGQRQDTFDGHTVYTLLSDYQGRSNGGDGWLRIMEFQPANNQIQVYTYTPYHDEFETDANSQFTLSYDMTGTTPPPPPDAPTLNSISNPDQDGAYTVSWESVSGAEDYELEEQYDSGSWSAIYTGTGLSQDLSGKADGSWCYQVRASNAGGSSGWSSSQCTTVATSPLPPDAPTLNSIYNPDQDGAYTVSWGSVSGAEDYELQEQSDSGSWGTIYTGVSTSQDLSGKADGSWCYQVRASNVGGSSEWSSTQCTTVETSPSPPDTPTLNSVSNPDQDGAYTVSWGSVSGAEDYELQEQFDSGSWGTIYTGVSTSQDLSGKADGSWCYQVRASNAGGSSGWSSSQCTTVSTPPPPPATPVLNSISNPDQDGTYTVSWGSVSGAEDYELQEQYDNRSWSAIYTGTGLSQELSGKADGSWCYQVRASNAGGSSGWSSSQCTTVATQVVTTEPPTTEPPPATTEPPPATTEPPPQVTPSSTLPPTPSHILFIPIILVH